MRRNRGEYPLPFEEDRPVSKKFDKPVAPPQPEIRPQVPKSSEEEDDTDCTVCGGIGSCLACKRGRKAWKEAQEASKKRK